MKSYCRLLILVALVFAVVGCGGNASKNNDAFYADQVANSMANQANGLGKEFDNLGQIFFGGFSGSQLSAQDVSVKITFPADVFNNEFGYNWNETEKVYELNLGSSLTFPFTFTVNAITFDGLLTSFNNSIAFYNSGVKTQISIESLLSQSIDGIGLTRNVAFNLTNANTNYKRFYTTIRNIGINSINLLDNSFKINGIGANDIIKVDTVVFKDAQDIELGNLTITLAIPKSQSTGGLKCTWAPGLSTFTYEGVINVSVTGTYSGRDVNLTGNITVNRSRTITVTVGDTTKTIQIVDTRIE